MATPPPSTPLQPSDYFQFAAIATGVIAGSVGLAGVLPVYTLAVLATVTAVLTAVGSALHQKGH